MLCLVCCIWLWFGQTGVGFGACGVVGYGLCFLWYLFGLAVVTHCYAVAFGNLVLIVCG